MAVSIPNSPQQTVFLCREALADFIGCTDIREEVSLQVYTMGLDECSTEQGCRSSLSKTNVGWKFLVTEGSGEVILVDIAASPGGLAVTGVTRGDNVRSVLDAIQSVSNVSELGARTPCDYELRWLSIPAILTECLWLRSADGLDLIRPVLALDEKLGSQPVFRLDEFLPVVRELALERLATDDEPRFE